ncbi:MAG TPA: macro domain-containing protein [Acidimicrobiales bacterium]|nr:macro domain-containing protein [Acidimicrobiales bacterium]
MPVVEQVRGDLFSADLPALAHGCNCSGTMAGPVAKEFRRRWPAMYRLYRARCREGRFLPGDVLAWPGPPRVYNLAVQLRPGRPATLAAVEIAVARMLEMAEAAEVPAVGMPRIGCDPGGLRWPEVEVVIDQLSWTSPVQLVVFEPGPATPPAAG